MEKFGASCCFSVARTLLLTDPSYTYDRKRFGQEIFSIQVELKNCESGKWLGSWSKHNFGTFSQPNERILQLEAESSKRKDKSGIAWEYLKDEFVGVDSGQAGIFNANRYPQGEIEGDSPFSKKCMEITMSKEQAGVIPEGVVSSTGWGDGSYDVYIKKSPKTQKIIACKIVFINQEDEDE